MDVPFGLGPETLGAAGTSSFYSSQLTGGAKGAKPEAVAGQFEAMFYRILFQQMRDTELADPLLDGPGLDQMRAMHHDELASHLGQEGHLGIKEMVLQEVAKQQQAMNSGLLKPATRGALS